MAFAAERHGPILRKRPPGRTNIAHVLSVVEILAEVGIVDRDTLAAAALHDLLEDGVATAEEIAERFGSQIAEMVVELTDDKTLARQERRRAQVETAPALSPGARFIRIADKIDNLQAMIVAIEKGTEFDAEEGLAYTDWAREVWSAARGKNAALDTLFLEVLARARILCRKRRDEGRSSGENR